MGDRLANDLNSFAQWETDWKMKFNVAKCHSMRVTCNLPDKQIKFDYSLHQQNLEQVQSAKYLGITITDNLDWGQHISEISCKATKTMGFLRRIWSWHLGTQRKLHTKIWFALSWSMQHLFGIPFMKLRLHRWRRCRGQLIHSGTVALDKDKYLTPAPNIRRTRASHESQYTRYLAYSEALENSFFLGTIPVLNGLPSSVSHPRPLRSLRLSYKPRFQSQAF